MNTSLEEPTLAPPGAGLPTLELFAARLFFGLRRLTATREAVDARFRKERAVIRRMIRSCSVETGKQRVLIERVRGLEDSSRNWSVWMTLDHLRIVNLEIARVIQSLALGHSLSGAASTAAVKPNPNTNEEVADEYEKACDTLVSSVAAVPDLRTETRFTHPWFGPLDAAGWHVLASGHMGIHREQLCRILADLP